MTSIAIIGTGRMGTAFAKRLIEMGHDVSVWNRTSANTAAAAEAGAKVLSNLAAAASADTILLSLTDAAAVAVVLDGLIAAGIEGRLVVDTTTLLPDDTRAIAGRVTEAGADFVDCPVGGTVGPALKGQLLGMAGGTDEAFGRAKPMLEQLCRRVEHLGAAGSGSHMKLAINLPLVVYWKTLAEAMTMLGGSGIPADKAISIIADSSGGPTVLRNRAQVVIDTLNGTDQKGTVDIATLMKDLELALQQARRSGTDMSISEAAHVSYLSAVDAGLGSFDGASLTRYMMRT
jgi:3-hydroxyisobutyrate dehydrogenase